MSWNNLTELYENGNEIGSHTHTHPHLTKISDKKLDFELGESKRILNPFNCETLAYPYGAYNTKIIEYTRKYYVAARGFCDKTVNSKDCGYNYLLGSERYKLKVFPTDYSGFDPQYPALFNLPFSKFRETVKSIIENEINNKTWVIFVFHGQYEMNLGSAIYNAVQSIRDRLGRVNFMRDIAALTDTRKKRISNKDANVNLSDVVLRFNWMCEYLTCDDRIQIGTVSEIVNNNYK
jgi:peptidoglycan/xylan/chitin deacetylase (PgdA/CDA1 family)